MTHLLGIYGEDIQELLAQNLDGYATHFYYAVEARMLRWARKFGANPDEADACVVEAFSRVYYALKELSAHEILDYELNGYLYTVVRNCVCNAINRRSPPGVRIIYTDFRPTEDGTCYDHEDDQAERPDSIYLKKEREQEILEVIETLPEQDREIVIARYFRGLTIKEIAQGLRRSEDSVKYMLKRSLRMLRTMLPAQSKG